MTSSTVIPTETGFDPDEIRVGYVDAEPAATADSLRERSDRLAVEPLEKGHEAVELVVEGGVDCVVIGPEFGRGDGLDLVERLRERRPSLPIFSLTAGHDEAAAAAALEAGATGCLPRSSVTESGRLAIRIERAVERASERRALELANTRFRAFTENSSFVILTVTEDGRIQYANDALETVFGYSPDEVIGGPLTALIPTEYRDRHRESFERYRRTRERSLDWSWIELPGKHAEGHEVPLAISFGETTVDGTRRFTAVIRDISARMQIERERDRILERIGDAFVSIDDEWRYTYLNDRAVELLDRPREELLGEPLLSTLSGLEESDAIERLEAAFADGTAATVTEFVPSLAKWFEIRAYPADDGLSIFLTDVTEKIRAEESLEASVTVLQTLYDLSTRTDASREEKLSDVLELGREYLDLPYAFLSRIDTEAETQTIVQSQGTHPLLQEDDSCPLSQAYCRKTVENDGLLAVADADGDGWTDDPAYETFELGSYVGAKVTVDGTLWGTLCFASSEPREGGGFTETERTLVKLMAKWVSYETERERSRDALERQNERLQEFASVVSHDLRNPLNVARGALEVAVEGGNEVDGTARLQDCERALDRMGRLIEDLLALAEQGSTVTELEPVPLSEVATTAWTMVETGEATLEVPDECWIHADRERVQQLLENLFRNALDHATTDDGTGLTVTVDTLEPDDGSDEAGGFYVADTGPGIPADERDRIFETGFTTAEDGTGFGLSIVERIAAAHDWGLSAAESRSGGARFEITGVSQP
ncbi:PAS domain S-box-containing protein [Halobiforma haloterrestris]|uniref:histidine kinase n=1 Tax=Natronobacterium haloterrestre TaxID=148448 RepID=A0A1I1DBY7_NATHA|nr:PAS domain S-box protein [Halobiforma haloterrestris]SFB72441.1 PAS domain S-box-containing protein [Halobiforma haloterrestris]